MRNAAGAGSTIFTPDAPDTMQRYESLDPIIDDDVKFL